MRNRLLIACASLLLAACSIGPDYVRPTIATQPDWRIDYEIFSKTLSDKSFPPGSDWLMLGPSGPRRLRLAIEHLAQHRGGGISFCVDLDPRWVIKLLKRGDIPEIGVQGWRLSNGIQVLLKPTDFKNDELLLSGFSPGGTSLVPDERYVSASYAVPILRPMMPQAAHLAAAPQGNTIVLVDHAANARRVADAFRRIDQATPPGQKCEGTPYPKKDSKDLK